MKNLATLTVVAAVLVGIALPVAAAESPQAPAPRRPGLYAVFDTSMGRFVCELYRKSAPLAVDNFVGLTEGTREWLNPRGDMVKKPYYNGVIFHRVVRGFMVQAGDVTGTGSFRPVLPFKDEIVASLRFDRAGVLAMANNGPNTNMSQFFITVAPAPHLNGKHTIFGRVVEGYEVVEKISNVSVGAGRKPLEDVVIRKVTIQRVK